MNYIPIKNNKDDVRNSVFKIISPKINAAAFAEVSSMYFLLGGIVNNVAGSALAEAKYHLTKSPFFCRKVINTTQSALSVHLMHTNID